MSDPDYRRILAERDEARADLARVRGERDRLLVYEAQLAQSGKRADTLQQQLDEARVEIEARKEKQDKLYRSRERAFGRADKAEQQLAEAHAVIEGVRVWVEQWERDSNTKHDSLRALLPTPPKGGSDDE